MGKKRKHSETKAPVPVKKSEEIAPERPKRTLLGWKNKNEEEDAEKSEPTSSSSSTAIFRNKEKVLVTCSRRISFRCCFDLMGISI